MLAVGVAVGYAGGGEQAVESNATSESPVGPLAAEWVPSSEGVLRSPYWNVPKAAWTSQETTNDPNPKLRR